jgi:hypothetical protein
MTDVQSASLSWNKAPVWGLRPDFYFCQTVSGLLMWGAFSDERTGLSFTNAPGPRQRSHFRVQSRGTRDHILLSEIRDFNFRPLLRLAGLRWRYWTPPPHGTVKLLPLYNLERTEYRSLWRTVNSPLLFSRCHGNVFVNIRCRGNRCRCIAN